MEEGVYWWTPLKEVWKTWVVLVVEKKKEEQKEGEREWKGGGGGVLVRGCRSRSQLWCVKRGLPALLLPRRRSQKNTSHIS